MGNLKGFWSYVHADDETENGRISKLARDVSDQFGLITGETIELFLDIDDIEIGDNWRDKINNSLNDVAFFIPIITPRFLLSMECRRETEYFLRKSSEIGISELLLPLIYADVQGLHTEDNEDEIIKIIRSIQYEDWREIRFLDIASEGYRRGVFRIARRLADANQRAEHKPEPTLPPEMGSGKKEE
jgi:hypothetical protein